MFPWLYAPAFYFPFSGSVNQDIAPETDWFFGGIHGSAGNGAIEKAVFSEVSYGKQLGIITEALLLALNAKPSSINIDKTETIDKLQSMFEKIEDIKQSSRNSEFDELKRQLKRLQEEDVDAFEALKKEFIDP